MSANIPWRRHALGATSFCLIVAGVVIGLIPGAADDWAFAQGISIKTGATLLMCWLAYPQLQRLQVWKVVSVVCLGAAFVFRPRLIASMVIFLAPLLFVLWLLRFVTNRPT